ncbi:hypothetical protein F7725_015817 [Dissostichus mawsoni]|uniref:Uncharacterized protein n=1 Tax=Dissostichus mawsoni TaxID=36200 RepID=A0A7J5YJ02_DISMA|nr:hypothetical protein F7725_015817 [Dissostichus mawsoni]
MSLILKSSDFLQEVLKQRGSRCRIRLIFRFKLETQEEPAEPPLRIGGHDPAQRGSRWTLLTRALINIIWQNQCLHLLCQSTFKTLSDPNVLWCSSVTPPSITRRGLCRQGSLFYPFVNHIPRQTARPAARPHNSCHLVLRHKHRHLTWLRAPEPSGAPGIWSEASSGDHFKDISTQALVKTTNLDTEMSVLNL